MYGQTRLGGDVMLQQSSMIPSSILLIWFRSLFSLGIVAGVIYLAHEWQQHSWRWDPTLQKSYFAPDFGWNGETALLSAAIGLVLLACMGKVLLNLFFRVAGRAANADNALQDAPRPRHVQYVKRPGGAELKVEFYGPEDATTLVFTHGWGLDSREWNYVKQELSAQFQLVVWDEPGLGDSKPSANRDYSLENLAGHLDAVLRLVDGPVLLVGHSIGGMITLTFCRLFPEAIGEQVRGLVLTHTTHTNPVRTTTGAAFLTLIEKPVLMPLLYLTILFSPLLRLSNWMSYLNGSMHFSTKLTSFAGTESWEQIDFIARFQIRASPAVLARGMLGMMRYDATDVLRHISVPVLVVAGSQDLVTKPTASEYLQRYISGSRLITLSPANHMGLIEHHTEFSKVVGAFATSTTLSSIEAVN